MNLALASQRHIPSHLHLVPPSGGSKPAQAVAFDGLYRQHAAFVARLAYRLLGRQADVDDVVHDVFIDLARQLSGLDNQESLRGWLSTVTVRAARRRLRRQRVRQWVGLDAVSEHYEGLVATTADPEQAELLRNVYRSMDKLPADQRLAWTLRYIEGEELEPWLFGARCRLPR